VFGDVVGAFQPRVRRVCAALSYVTPALLRARSGAFDAVGRDARVPGADLAAPRAAIY
jgi:hypothetical protein